MLRRHLIAGMLLLTAGARARACTAPVSVPGTMVGRALVLDAAIDGRAAHLLLDTGAERTVLTDAGVAALRLPLDQWVSTGMEGVGGVERHRNADVGSLVVGGLALRRPLLPRIESLPVIPTVPVSLGGTPVAGLLGMDLLVGYDIELDFAAPRMVLQNCGQLPDWTRHAVTLAASSPRIGILVVPVRVNGVVLRALIDTGSSVTLLGAGQDARLGIGAAAVAHGAGWQARGVGPASLSGRLVTVRLQLGPEIWPGQPVLVAALRDPAYDMVLGMDVLVRRPLLLSLRRGIVRIGTGRD